MSKLTRRRFLEDSLLAAAAAIAVPGSVASAAGRPKSREVIRVGVIGVRGRGRAHIKAFRDSPDSEVVAICDPDSGVIAPSVEAVPDAKYYRDIRELLDDKTIDAVSIATPNHWHSLAAIWALQAGKHVYVEKPISHDVLEGRAVVNAVRNTGLILQHGTQARSQAATRDALAWMQAGGMGRVAHARGLCYKRRDSIGKVDAPIDPPSTIDMNLWTGPARMEPIRRRELHYDWHWVFNTGNGDIGNQGVHQMDIARWGLALDDHPRAVMSVGGRVGYDDDGETPNSQLVRYDYGDNEILFEVRGLKTDPYHGAHIGVVFAGEHGYLVSAAYNKVVAFDLEGNAMKTFTGGNDDQHYYNFLEAVKSGRPDKLNAPAIEGHRSAALCHLGNISHLLGDAVPLGSIDEPFGSESANTAYREMRDHLVSNGLVPESTKVSLGPNLAFDDASERFFGPRAAAANALLIREYREPFKIPEDLL